MLNNNDNQTPKTPANRLTSNPYGSRLEKAFNSVSSWPEKDKRFFINNFMSQKTSAQIREEMDLTPAAFEEMRRVVMRKFMYGSQEQ
jgi:hypothetical protein